MSKEKGNQESSAENNRPGRTSDEPKGQGIMKADAEGAGSEATEFAEGGSNSQTDAQSNANKEANSEPTVSWP